MHLFVARLCRALVALVSLLCLAVTASAQGESSTVEVGGQLSGIQLVNESGAYQYTAGFGGELDVNVARRLAIDTRVIWFPRHQPAFDALQGGRTVMVTTGLRATLVETRHASIYGLVLPGVIHFTKAHTGFTTTTIPGDGGPVSVVDGVTGPATNFALGLGGGVQVAPTRRLIVRVELINVLYASPGAEIALSKPNASGAFLTVGSDASIASLHQLSVSASYRLGTLRSVTRDDPVHDRWETGPQFSGLVSTSAFGTPVLNKEPGVGGFVSYRLAKYCFADATVMAFPRKSHIVHTPFDGGRLFQGLVGVKVGVQGGRIGVFAKIRAGTNSHSQVLRAIRRDPYSVTDRGSSLGALDVGGVLEVYFKRRLMVRLDAGDTVSYFHRVSYMLDDMSVSLDAPPNTDAIQMTAGFGWRF